MIFEKLCKDVGYAIRSNNENLIYECYGAAKMARTLEAISKEQFDRLHRTLIPGWINNVAHRKELSHTFNWREI